MNKKLPKVYVNTFNKNIDNNTTVFYSKLLEKEKKVLPIEKKISRKEYSKVEINIKDKINNMFNSPNYIYKIEATIVTKDGEKIKKEIIGKVDNKLITIDDEYISIDTIDNIIY